MNIRACITSLIIISFLSLSACAHRESRIESFYGTSYELAKFNQIVDLDAEKNNTEPVDTLEGIAAKKVVDTYINSFGNSGSQASLPSLIAK